MFAPIAGTTNYENRLTIGCYSQPITVHMLLADRTEEEYFGVKVSLEFGQAVNTTVSKHIWKQVIRVAQAIYSLK